MSPLKFGIFWDLSIIWAVSLLNETHILRIITMSFDGRLEPGQSFLWQVISVTVS